MAEGGRWEQAQDIVKTWTASLDIGECALILFSDNAELFKDGTRFWFDLRGMDGEKNKGLLVEQFDLSPAILGSAVFPQSEGAKPFLGLSA